MRAPLLRFCFLSVFGLTALTSLEAAAVSTTVTAVDTASCDPLVVPTSVEELGLAPNFPNGSRISAVTGWAQTTGCTLSEWYRDNVLVSITNENSISFSDLWYVAQPDTTLTNADGTVKGMPAFKIDSVGDNRPLEGEGILDDGIFAPGETWTFHIRGYSNANNLPPSAFRTIGVPTGDPLSSGNIIAIPVPEPTTAGSLGLGLLGFAGWRRARA